MEKDKSLLWVYILKPNYEIIYDLRKRGVFARTRNGFIGLFQYKLMDLPPPPHPHETNSVLLQIGFVFVNLNKNLSFGIFKIKMVQSHKNVENTKPFDFESKF